MHKKDVLIGFIIGLVATAFGLVFAIQIFGNSDDWGQVISSAIEDDVLTKLLSIGALLNLGAFFLFLKRNQDHKAKGVLIATVLVLVLTLILKFKS